MSSYPLQNLNSLTTTCNTFSSLYWLFILPLLPPPPPWSPFRDIAKFITQFVVEEIDENTSLEDLQKMMAVALVYRVLVCIYEVRLTSSTAPEVAAP